MLPSFLMLMILALPGDGGFGNPEDAIVILGSWMGKSYNCQGRTHLEKCCYYANKSEIIYDKIKKLQEDLERRH